MTLFGEFMSLNVCQELDRTLCTQVILDYLAISVGFLIHFFVLLLLGISIQYEPRCCVVFYFTFDEAMPVALLGIMQTDVSQVI